jgi:uncharacterized membrane protein (UPF0127 family)
MKKKNEENKKSSTLLLLKDLFVIILVLGITLVLFGFANLKYGDKGVELEEAQSESIAPDLSTYDQGTVSINGDSYQVALANDAFKRGQGLSNQESLMEDYGMMFFFHQAGRHSFWMKDMNFALDIIWVDNTGEIIHVAPNVSSDSFPNTFTPNQPALHVLEFNGGFMDEKGYKVGDFVEYDI